MEVAIETYRTGAFETNVYVVRCGREYMVVDAGMQAGPLASRLAEAGIVPGRIVLTHGHADHIAGIVDLVASFPDISIWCPAADAEMLSDPRANVSAMFGMAIRVRPPDEVFSPGQTIQLGDSAWRVLDTSGHTPGGVSLYEAEAGCVFTGDALFAGGIGRTDLPGASQAKLLANIAANLLVLPAETRVLPGHGPESTIGIERRTNPFLVGGRPEENN